MKKLFTKMFVIMALLLAGGGVMTSCTPDPVDVGPKLVIGTPVVNSAISVDIPLATRELAVVGYKLVKVEEGKEPTPPKSAQVLFMTGKRIDGCPTVINLTAQDDGLVRGTKYVIYIAASISDTEFFNNGEIFSTSFETPDNYADQDVVVLNRDSEGADILVFVPERVKEQGRRIKWGIANIAMINYYGKTPIPEKLFSNDVVYPASLFKNDTTLNINHYNVYRRNADGEIGYYYFAEYNEDGVVVMGECGPNDPRVETGEAEPVQYYQHFQPGEPLVLMMSEVDYAGCKELFHLEGRDYENHLKDDNCGEKHPMIDWSWGPGWYWYPYDFQAYIQAVEGDREPGELPMPGVGGGSQQPTIDFNKFWHEGAWYKQLEIELPGPAKFETGSVEVNTTALRTDGGSIVFTPQGDTFAYFVGIMPDRSDMGAGYYDLLNMIDNKSQYLQWLTTSEIAPYLGIYPYYTSEGRIVMNLESVLSEISAGMKYHIIINAVPSKIVDGDFAIDTSKQSFQHITFTLPEYTLAEPELIVTPYESYSPYKVKFNVKNANPSLPVKKVVYASNYTRDFASYMSVYEYTYTDLVMMNDGYAYLTEAEIMAVNSEAGFDMEFDVRENSRYTLAVMGWNKEGRPSNPDKEGSKAVAEALSTSIPAADRLDMKKLNALKGDWTATATIKTYDYNTGKASQSQKSWKVSIGDLNTNETLTDEEYKYLEGFGVTKEAADTYLAEYNKQAVDYNAAVLGQNRVLCMGWDVSGKRETSTAAPWDLFLMNDYNASLVDYLFHDFGPKWFLQTDAKGNIFVPVNYNVVPTMMCWYNGLEHYLCPGNYEEGVANYIYQDDPFDVETVGIPVEISADGNTVTLKSVVVNTDVDGTKKDVTLYPAMIYDNQGQLAFFNPYVVSEVVLTKGWNEPKTASVKLSTNRGQVNVGSKRVVNGEHFTAPVKPHSRTVFAPAQQAKIKTTVVNHKNPTKEEMRQGMDKYMSRFNRGIRK